MVSITTLLDRIYGVYSHCLAGSAP